MVTKLLIFWKVTCRTGFPNFTVTSLFVLAAAFDGSFNAFTFFKEFTDFFGGVIIKFVTVSSVKTVFSVMSIVCD